MCVCFFIAVCVAHRMCVSGVRKQVDQRQRLACVDETMNQQADYETLELHQTFLQSASTHSIQAYTAGCLSFGPIGQTFTVSETQACARRPGTGASVSRWRRERRILLAGGGRRASRSHTRAASQAFEHMHVLFCRRVKHLGTRRYIKHATQWAQHKTDAYMCFNTAVSECSCGRRFSDSLSVLNQRGCAC